MEEQIKSEKVYESYIFDLYGTLIDIQTNEEKPSVWKKLAYFYNMRGAEYTAAHLKTSYHRIIEESLFEKEKDAEVQLVYVFKRLYEEKGISPSEEEIILTGQIFRSLSMERIRLYDGVQEILMALHERGKRIYLLSNAQRIFTEPELRMLHLYERFDGILFSSDVGVKKPSLKLYDVLFEKYQLIKAESIMVGNDDLADIHGANAYGLDSIYIHTSQSPQISLPLPENSRWMKSIMELLKEA